MNNNNESSGNIQVDEGTITTVEEVNENVPQIVNNNLMKNILPANINTTKLEVIKPLTQDIQNENEMNE